MIENPSMEHWQQAWAQSDSEQLKAQYTADGMVLAPNRALLSGQDDILAFFEGGFPHVEVRFFPEHLEVDGSLAIERGLVKDFVRGTQEIAEACDYMVAWRLEHNTWKIVFHTWSIAKV